MSVSQFTIAIAGVPNCGKTTLFNALTGMSYRVANYPGITVEKKEAELELDGIGRVKIVDLPGCYTLFGGTPDEKVCGEYFLGTLKTEKIADAIICVIDACNLERNLFLLSQLIDTGIPVIAALNLNQRAQKHGVSIQIDELSKLLGIEIINISSLLESDYLLLISELKKLLRNLNSYNVQRFTWCNKENYLLALKKLGEMYFQEKDIKVDETRCINAGLHIVKDNITDFSSNLREALGELYNSYKDEGLNLCSFEVEQRYKWIDSLVCCCVNHDKLSEHSVLSNRIDRILTNKVWGSLIFFLLVALVFQSIFVWAYVPMNLINSFFVWLKQILGEHIPESRFRSFISSGILSGVGGVLVFIPQIAVLHFFIAILEESGYLARAAFLMDNVMRKFGLQGRCFLPLLSSVACAVPGIMSCRGIPSWGDRLATIMAAPMMCCSARIPIYTLLIAAFIPSVWIYELVSLQGLVLLLMYCLGVFGAILTAIFFKRTLFRGPPAEFVMEMPPYHIPSLKVVFRGVANRLWIFIQSVGTTILTFSILIWVLASYPKVETNNKAEALRESYLGHFGSVIEPIMKPLGYDWKISISIVSSFASRELFVSSMGLLHNMEESQISTDSLADTLRNAKQEDNGKPAYNLLTALSLLVFYAFSCQCLSTIVVCKRETGNWKWAMVMFVYMTTFAYIAAFLTYRIGSFLWQFH